MNTKQEAMKRWVICMTAVLSLGTVQSFEVDASEVRVPIGTVTPDQTCQHVYCPPDGRCHGGKCICRPGSSGRAALGCVEGNVNTCVASSDVISHNFQAGHIDIPSPCRYELTSYRMSSPAKKGMEVKCGAMVYAANDRYKGKMYVGAFDLSFNIKRVDEDKAYFVQFRGFGTVDPETKEYVFQRQIRVQSKFPWFEPGESSVLYPYVFEVDEESRRLRFELPVCGFTLLFRPAHPTEGKDQKFLPGVVFGVDQDVGEVDWTHQTSSVCLAPPGDGVPTMEDISRDMGMAGNDDLTLAKMVFSQPKIYQDYLPKSCNSLRQRLAECSDAQLTEATVVCTSLLNTPRFLSCISKNDEQGELAYGIALFEECVRSVCAQDQVTCSMLRDRMRGACPDFLEGVVMATHSCDFSGIA